MTAILNALKCMIGRHDLSPHMVFFGWTCKRCGYWRKECE